MEYSKGWCIWWLTSDDSLMDALYTIESAGCDMRLVKIIPDGENIRGGNKYRLIYKSRTREQVKEYKKRKDGPMDFERNC